MKELLDKFLSDGFSAQNILVIGGVAVVLLISIRSLKSLVKQRAGGLHFQIVDCSSCGWQGNVSRFAGRCPQCNVPLGDRKARPKT
jgi:hypothetical protein